MLQYKLSKERYSVDWARNAEEAEAYIEAGSYDMYILDWMMPGKSGLELCKERREKQDKTAILMLTAKDEVADKVNGLMTGADDYLVKPFVFEELFARIHALDRRKQASGYDTVYTLDDLVLNPVTQEVSRAGKPIYLTRREFQLLAYFMRHAGQVLSREQMLNHVWGSEADVTLNAVDASVKLLRKKIDDPFKHKMIQSVHGRGYRLVAEDAGHV